MHKAFAFLGLAGLLACGSPAEAPKSSSKPATSKPKEAAPVQSAPKQVGIPRGRHTEFFREYAASHPENRVVIRTRLGDITLELYDDTPLHRANFLFLASEGYLDETLFYRIEKGFMVQGGGSDDEAIAARRNKLGKYRVPAEIKPHHIHKRGAIAMARNYSDNPGKESSSYNFYIVQGERFDAKGFKALKKEYGTVVPANNQEVYQTIGGAPHLDGEHTVFGEVVSGMEVVDRMTELEVDKGGWPYEDVPMTLEVLPRLRQIATETRLPSSAPAPTRC